MGGVRTIEASPLRCLPSVITGSCNTSHQRATVLPWPNLLIQLGMVQRDDITEGRLLRLLTDCLDVPAGTLATVETAGTVNRVWRFTVRWHTHTAIATRSWSKHVAGKECSSQRSLNLWESNLEMFELATEESARAAAASTKRRRRVPKVYREVDPAKLAQLRLPFDGCQR
jgi:hypothetical protein